MGLDKVAYGRLIVRKRREPRIEFQEKQIQRTARKKDRKGLKASS